MKNRLLFLLSLCMAGICTGSIKAYAQCSLVAAANPICHSTGTTTISVTGGGITGDGWASIHPAIASVTFTTGTGTCSVTAGTAGTTTIWYADGLGDICSIVMTIDPTPSAPSISGTLSVCLGFTSMLSGSPAGGTWSSANTAIASVDATGDVTGEGAGTTLIFYTITNSCGSASAHPPFRVYPLPDPGTISGTTEICAGTTTTLTESVTGGVWSSDMTSVAVIDPSTGIVTGVAMGNADISYTVTDVTTMCMASTFVTMTIDPTPGGPATMTGAAICGTGTTTLTETTTGGTWSSDNTAIATVDGYGDVMGTGTGTVTISYTVTNGYTCSASATAVVTVNPLPNIGVISSSSGAFTVCEGATITLSDAVPGGTWSSSNAPAATIGSSTGLVGGVSAGAGMVTMTYTITDGITMCTSTTSVLIVVNPTPSSGTISGGTSAVCQGVPIPLSDATTGGQWNSDNTAVATVDGSGNVTSVSGGTATISYTVTNIYLCSSPATVVVTINPVPAVGNISSSSGAFTVCEGATIILSDAVPGGTWSSSNAPAATIGSSTGLVGGVSAGAGHVTMTYTITDGITMCTSTTSVLIVVNPSPGPGTITGIGTVCATQTTSLSDAVSGGMWSSSNTAIATVDQITGIVTGVTAGTATTSYTVTNGSGCSASATLVVTVNTMPDAGTISGATAVCYTSTITLSDAATGGSWSSSNTALATVGNGALAGIVYGTDVSGGPVTISYTVTLGSCTAYATTPITVDVAPYAGTITTGSSFDVCIGNSLNLSSNGDAGGTWSSSNTAIATVDAGTGVVSGVAAGYVTISYTVVNSCLGSASASAMVTVDPFAGTISGTASSVVVGASISLTASLAGGAWGSSDNTLATVDGFGTVWGVWTGTPIIFYSINTGCGTGFAYYPITVEPLLVLPDSMDHTWYTSPYAILGINTAEIGGASLNRIYASVYYDESGTEKVYVTDPSLSPIMTASVTAMNRMYSVPDVVIGNASGTFGSICMSCSAATDYILATAFVNGTNDPEIDFYHVSESTGSLTIIYMTSVIATPASGGPHYEPNTVHIDVIEDVGNTSITGFPYCNNFAVTWDDNRIGGPNVWVQEGDLNAGALLPSASGATQINTGRLNGSAPDVAGIQSYSASGTVDDWALVTWVDVSGNTLYLSKYEFGGVSPTPSTLDAGGTSSAISQPRIDALDDYNYNDSMYSMYYDAAYAFYMVAAQATSTVTVKNEIRAYNYTSGAFSPTSSGIDISGVPTYTAYAAPYNDYAPTVSLGGNFVFAILHDMEISSGSDIVFMEPIELEDPTSLASNYYYWVNGSGTPPATTDATPCNRATSVTGPCNYYYDNLFAWAFYNSTDYEVDYKITPINAPAYSLRQAAPAPGNNTTAHGWRVYPNPASNALIVSAAASSNAPTAYHVIDMAGRELQSGSLSGGSTNVDVSGLAPGTYVIQLYNSGGSDGQALFVKE